MNRGTRNATGHVLGRLSLLPRSRMDAIKKQRAALLSNAARLGRSYHLGRVPDSMNP
jgi:hypothetical protein